MNKHTVISVIWIAWAILIAIKDKKQGKDVSPMFHTALICSVIWAATG